MKQWASSRVAQATVGALLVGGITVAVIVLPSLHLGLLNGSPAGSTTQSQQATQVHSSAHTDVTGDNGGPHAPASSGGLPSAPATSTPSLGPNVPTATSSGQSGQPVDLHGNIVQVNTAGNFFTYQELGGPLDTIYVTATSRYAGSASSLSTLTPGRAAEVTGVRQSATMCVAALVDEASDNG